MYDVLSFGVYLLTSHQSYVQALPSEVSLLWTEKAERVFLSGIALECGVMSIST